MKTPFWTALLALAGCGGRAVPPIELADLDGKLHRPAVVAAAKANVLVFLTVDCPIANGYAPEIQSIIADYRSRGFAFYLVHVDPDVTAEIAARHAKEYGYAGVPILLDPDHLLVRRAGASATPEAAVLLADGTIPYRGRIDNWYADFGEKRPRPTKRDLRDVLDAVLAGRRVAVRRTPVIGCDIPDVQ